MKDWQRMCERGLVVVEGHWKVKFRGGHASLLDMIPDDGAQLQRKVKAKN